jgi:hypothetical protein
MGPKLERPEVQCSPGVVLSADELRTDFIFITQWNKLWKIYFIHSAFVKSYQKVLLLCTFCTYHKRGIYGLILILVGPVGFAFIINSKLWILKRWWYFENTLLSLAVDLQLSIKVFGTDGLRTAGQVLNKNLRLTNGCLPCLRALHV